MSQPEYIVYIRVPMPRGDFVDPPPVHWDSTKDEALWKILSDAAQKQIDWSQVYDMADIHDDSKLQPPTSNLRPPTSDRDHIADTGYSRRAAQFDVPVDFLSQQVAYLTERHASQVRAQVRKATAAAKGSAVPSPVSGSEPAASAPAYPRTGSALSTRRDSPMPRQDANASATPATTLPARPDMSRHASLNTSLKDGSGASPRHTSSFPNRALDQGARQRISSLPIKSEVAKPLDPPATSRGGGGTSSPGPAESSSDESSDDESSPAQSRIIRRPPRFQQQQDTTDKYQDDDGDDESEPAFQPFQAPSDQPGQDNMASTLKGDQGAAWRRAPKSSRRPVTHQSQTSDDSSTGSPAVAQQQQSRELLKAPSLLSPRRNAELAGRSPSREDSEGTPSMGSSFSDLDDASITQSALEEALASHMNRPVTGVVCTAVHDSWRSRQGSPSPLRLAIPAEQNAATRPALINPDKNLRQQASSEIPPSSPFDAPPRRVCNAGASGTSAIMFRRLWTGLPRDAVFASNLEDLGHVSPDADVHILTARGN
ncbi:hypothetical protein E4U53_006017 [Claviceps sorghi]|nr:hypothetical protein E4U53_006017 [Claviceps sorghi]